MTPLDAEKFARLHRFTVITFCLTLLAITSVFAYFIFMFVPDIQYKVTKQALGDLLDERIESVTK